MRVRNDDSKLVEWDKAALNGDMGIIMTKNQLPGVVKVIAWAISLMKILQTEGELAK